MPKGKKKDPNKPKGKKAAYIFFFEERRRQSEKIDFPEFSKQTSEEWKKLTAKEKEKYEKLAAKDKKRYEEEMANYSPPSSDEEESSKKRKRKKKDKDPDQPKRNMSSYFHFCGEKRPDVRDKHPDASVGETAKLLSEIWKSLSDKERERYEELARKDKERYLKAMDEYNGKKNKKSKVDE